MTQSTGPENITARFQEAWNTHDMDAFGRLFHSDATFVNPVRDLLARGRPDRRRPRRHPRLNLSRLDAWIDAPDVWTRLSAGDAHPAGRHQVDALILAVVTRRNGEWRIRAAENVTLANPMTGAALLRP